MEQVALVGGTHIHTPGFVKRLKDRPDFQVKWVWEPNSEVAGRLAADLGAKTAFDPSTIWGDPEVRAVIICSETNRHKDLVLAAAAAHKHMFVEKPLGIGARDSFTMARAIEDSGVLFQTGYFNRGHPIFQFLRQQVALGSFGKITRIRHSNCHAGSLGDWFGNKEWSWMTDPRIAGFGAFGDLGTHSLDLLLYLVGSDVERVSACIRVATGRYGDCDEYGEGMLQFASGIIGTVAAGWVDVANPVTFLLSGIEGHAHVVEEKLYFKSSKVPGADGKTPWTDLPPAWPHAFEIFLDALVGKPHPAVVPVGEAALNSAVMEAFYQASQHLTWVTPVKA